MAPPRPLSRRLSRSTGVLGDFVRRTVNRGNAKMNAFAVQKLGLEPTNRVLEIGFGGGLTLPTLFEGAAFVGGIDWSADAVARAEARFAEHLAVGRATFCQGRVESLPFERASFDKACSVDTLYFWHSLDEGFAEIHRVLSPGGRAAIGFLPKERMERVGFPSGIFMPHSADDVVASAEKMGFATVRVTRPAPTTPWNVVVAFRPSE